MTSDSPFQSHLTKLRRWGSWDSFSIVTKQAAPFLRQHHYSGLFGFAHFWRLAFITSKTELTFVTDGYIVFGHAATTTLIVCVTLNYHINHRLCAQELKLWHEFRCTVTFLLISLCLKVYYSSLLMHINLLWDRQF